MGPIILFVVFASTMSSISANNYPPVILVPGIGGSQLQAKVTSPPNFNGGCAFLQSLASKLLQNSYFSVWLNPLLWIPFVNKCSVYLLELNYNNVTRKTTDLPGVQTRVVGFGDPYWVEKYDYDCGFNFILSLFSYLYKNTLNSYFKNLADALQPIGYERNVSLRGAPFDFRKGPNESEEYFEKLKNLVEETYRINGNRKVVFVTHSYGGPMTISFLRTQTQQWRDKYVRAMISLSAVLGGTMKSIRQFATGDEFEKLPFYPPYLYDDTKAILRTFPSMAFFMPNKKIWEDKVLVSGPQKNYSLSNLEEFFEDLNDLSIWEMRKDQLPYLSMEPPGVEFHCGYSTTEKDETTEMLIYDEPGDFPDHPKYELGPGDGTVNLRSLEYCKKWTKQQNQKVYVKHFPNVDHLSIVNDRRTINYILRVLKGYARENEIYEKH